MSIWLSSHPDAYPVSLGWVSASQWLVSLTCALRTRSLGGCLVPSILPWLTHASEMQAGGDQHYDAGSWDFLPVRSLMNCNTSTLTPLGRFSSCFVSLNNGAILNIPDFLCSVYTFIGFNPKPLSTTSTPHSSRVRPGVMYQPPRGIGTGALNVGRRKC